MDEGDVDDAMYRAAREAIDEEELARVLELAAGADCDDDAVAALREVTADTLVGDALAAARAARWRGRLPTGEDVGTAAEQRRASRGRGESGDAPPIPAKPASAKGEWESS